VSPESVARTGKVSTMADREVIAAIILAGMLANARGTSQTPASLIPTAIGAADDLIKALDASPSLAGPVGFTRQDDEPPPGTP
jgi:hypothetical protein